jgi:hypothetical protein
MAGVYGNKRQRRYIAIPLKKRPAPKDSNGNMQPEQHKISTMI